MKIDHFSGEYDFLSNFYEAPVTWKGVVYPTSEHAYQAAKTLDSVERNQIRLAETPAIAKKLGRKVTIREDWEEVKFDFMFKIVWNKFILNQELATKLLATGDAELIEGNWWGDTYWGVCRGEGQNNLGLILMTVRGILRNPKNRSAGIT